MKVKISDRVVIKADRSFPKFKNRDVGTIVSIDSQNKNCYIMFNHLQEPLNVSWQYIVGSNGEKLSFPQNAVSVYPVVEPPKPVRRTYDVCPGCHSNDVQTGSDGFGDGDFWYHCRNCGEEGFCDYGSEADVLRGNKPPTKQPPYFDEHPLPAQYGVGTPTQIRARATKP